jgi:hypothetical protein
LAVLMTISADSSLLDEEDRILAILDSPASATESNDSSSDLLPELNELDELELELDELELDDLEHRTCARLLTVRRSRQAERDSKGSCYCFNIKAVKR